MERMDGMTGEQRTRRRFTAEYKREAAGLVIDTGRTVTAVANGLGVGQASQQTTDLVERALRMAWTLRQPAAAPTVLHSDRGSQYTSMQINQVTQALGMIQSMGRTGVCWDNAMSESFWSTLKTEFYDRRVWMTRQEAQRAVGRWIEEVYNRERIHTSLGMRTPVEFEETMTNTRGHHDTLMQAA